MRWPTRREQADFAVMVVLFALSVVAIAAVRSWWARDLIGRELERRGCECATKD